MSQGNIMAKKATPNDLNGLTLLGSGTTVKPVRKLETFPNHTRRDYTVTLTTEEFTCVCPMTGQPDFAKITIQYIPGKKIVESKSLKLYLWSFRNEGVFHEHLTNIILDDLVAVLLPRWCKVTAQFAVRGGIAITVEAEYHESKKINQKKSRG
jgi:7-cyano-7-deazaguanine reductase